MCTIYRAVSRLCLLLTAFGMIVACGDSGGGDGRGMVQRQIAVDGVLLTNARFSPDGARLAVNHDGDDGDKVATIAIDGTDLQIVAEGASYLTAPTWTADGEAIIFVGDDVYQVNADGTDQQSLFSAFAAMSPDLSPDQTRLVYGVNGSNLEIKDLDSDDPATDLGMTGYSPRFSPDGTQIAFATEGAIKVMSAEGEEVRDVVTGDLSYLSSVDWFPDGERLAITSQNGIEIVDVESGSRSTLVDAFATKDIDVSPDGTSLVYGINGQKSLTILEGI